MGRRDSGTRQDTQDEVGVSDEVGGDIVAVSQMLMMGQHRA